MKFNFDMEPGVWFYRQETEITEEEELAAQKYLESIEVKKHELVGKHCKIKFSSTSNNNCIVLNVYEKENKIALKIKFDNDGQEIFTPIQNIELI